MQKIKRMFKATLKVSIFLAIILFANFTLDLIIHIIPWITPILLVISIIALITLYYIKDKED